MGCSDCNQSQIVPVSITGTYFQGSPCFQVEGCGSGTNAKCVFYNGPRLTCLNIDPNDSLEYALQKMDEIVCNSIGDYSTYTMNCLPAWWGSAITTEAQFVDAITSYACNIADDLSDFTEGTFSTYQADVNTRFVALEIPGITCATASVSSTDTLQAVLTKYCAKLTSLTTAIGIGSVVWDNCFTVISTPTTIAAGFQVLADQICSIQSAASSLPTFNNIGTCLPAPLTSSDTLVSTVNKIKTRLCQAPTWDATNLTWGCIGAPGSSTDIEEAIQSIVSIVNSHTLAFPTFDGSDFVITPTSGDPCDGVTVSLATPINQDRFVAANAMDVAPSTLINKLIGVGITVDDTTNAGKITLTSTATTDSFEVKAASADTSPDFLDAKLNGGGVSGITITPNYNAGTEQIDLMVTVDLPALFNVLLDELVVGTALYDKFCEKVANCPSPCDAPTNVQAIPGNSPTTSTTTLP